MVENFISTNARSFPGSRQNAIPATKLDFKDTSTNEVESDTLNLNNFSPRYILSTKGHRLLTFGDYIFRKKSGNAAKSYWICAYDRGFKCRARLRLLEGSDPPKIIGKSGTHNHGKEFGRVQARELVNSMKERAMSGKESLEDIYSSSIEKESLTEEGLVALATKQALKAAMRRVRRKKHMCNLTCCKERPQQVEDIDTPLDLSMKSKYWEQHNSKQSKGLIVKQSK
ncbi:uncharacterized protein LOC120348475 [Styela clava]